MSLKLEMIELDLSLAFPNQLNAYLLPCLLIVEARYNERRSGKGQSSECAYLGLLPKVTHLQENLSIPVLYNIVWKCGVVKIKLFVVMNKM